MKYYRAYIEVLINSVCIYYFFAIGYFWTRYIDTTHQQPSIYLTFLLGAVALLGAYGIHTMLTELFDE